MCKHTILYAALWFISNSVTPHFPTLVEKCLRIFCSNFNYSPAHTKKNRPRVDSFHLLPNFGRKIETLSFSSINLSIDDAFQLRFDALLVLTFKLSHKKRCSYLRCCDRDREFGSVVPFKCKLLNVPRRRKEILMLSKRYTIHVKSFGRDIHPNSGSELVILDSAVWPIWRLQLANDLDVRSNC